MIQILFCFASDTKQELLYNHLWLHKLKCYVLSNPLLNLSVPWSESLTRKTNIEIIKFIPTVATGYACHCKESFAIKFQVSSCATYPDRKKKKKNYICSVFWSLHFGVYFYGVLVEKAACSFFRKKIDVRFFSYHRVASARSFKSTEEKYCTSFQSTPHSKNLAPQSFTCTIEETVN